MKKIIPSISICLSLLCVTLFSTGCTNTQGITEQGFYLDTVISITLYSSDAEEQIQACFQLIETYENYFSNTIEGSDIWEINHSNHTPVTVHDETISLLETGLYYGELSNGAFDITLGNLSTLWDFDNNDGTVPDAEDIASAVSTIDDSQITINGNEVTYTGDGSIDLGGIAKGYIADRVKEYLLSQGITEGLINLGGNVLCIGSKSTGDDYCIGIQEPFSDDGSVIASVDVSDLSVVTSGTYQRYFELDGTIYHHILNLETGYPEQNGLASVTIITASSVDADALSTITFLKGLDNGMELIESIPDTEAIFITTDNEIYSTSGIGTTIPFIQN